MPTGGAIPGLHRWARFFSRRLPTRTWFEQEQSVGNGGSVPCYYFPPFLESFSFLGCSFFSLASCRFSASLRTMSEKTPLPEASTRATNPGANFLSKSLLLAASFGWSRVSLEYHKLALDHT